VYSDVKASVIVNVGGEVDDVVIPETDVKPEPVST
jgi:hypothetical protein